MKKYLVAFLVLTVWFCLNQPTVSANKSTTDMTPGIELPKMEAPLLAVPEAELASAGAPVADEKRMLPPGTVIGKARIVGTSENSPIDGMVTFTQTPKGVMVGANIDNVPDPGNHGFHVHENGSCDDGGKAAGGHYNPAGVKHGHLMSDGHEMAHAGDMGNIFVNESGMAVYTGFLPGLALAGGKYNIAGRAVILHANEDDFGQPTGNAGGRIGCGIIVVE